MNRRISISSLSMFRLVAIGFVLLVSAGWAADAPSPLLSAGHPVDWLFVFKLNTKTFPECGTGVVRKCTFGGTVQDYKSGFSLQFAYASSENGKLQAGNGCAGETTTDPLGATFGQIYNGTYNYLIWNDQFYDDPVITGCKKECGSPWGHSKGMLAWNSAGEGMVLQVSTPSWPASGGAKAPRKKDGNTLGCVLDDDVLVSQHFFALKLTKDDLVKVLSGLQNASVVTDPKNPQIVKNGGPPDVQKLVNALGVKSKATSALIEPLSSGVELISKPSALNVPPWQMVSSFLKGVSLRTATWWASPEIPSTTATTKIACWSNTLGKTGPVEIATTGTWADKEIGLTGGLGSDFNHAKIGVSTSGTEHYAIFGDMNQQGTLSGPNCASSQNGRGGMFYVVNNAELAASVAELIKGKSADPAP
jgi:hypothetical protein